MIEVHVIGNLVMVNNHERNTLATYRYRDEDEANEIAAAVLAATLEGVTQ